MPTAPDPVGPTASVTPTSPRPLGVLEQTGDRPGVLITEAHRSVGHKLDAKYERLRAALYGTKQGDD